jgi:hypothetical protein
MATDQPSLKLQQQKLRITEVTPAEDAARLVEVCGGDRLDAWRIALGRSKSDPRLADYWIEVADAVARFQTIPTPRGVASLVCVILGLCEAEGFTAPTLPRWRDILSLVTDPRVRAWAKAARGWAGSEDASGVRS